MNPKKIATKAMLTLAIAGPIIRPEEEGHTHEEDRVPDGFTMNAIQIQATSAVPSVPQGWEVIAPVSMPRRHVQQPDNSTTQVFFVPPAPVVGGLF